MTRSIALFAPLVLAACASAAEPAAAPPRNALEMLRAGGSFAFSLDESDPAAHFHAQCAQEHPNDAAGADACYAHVREEGATEGIRFSLDQAGKLVWTSYGVEEGKPATYIEAHFEPALEKEGLVSARLLAPATGIQMKEGPFPEGKVFHFQVLDPNTVVMVDGQKGKLVFHRLP
jgi:hypothetical protein